MAKSKLTHKTPKSTSASSSRRKAPSTPIEKYSRAELEKSLKIDAKALGIPSGSAAIFIKKTLDAVEKSLNPKEIITEHDLNSAISKELKKYHKDFAYIYQNRDKIV